MTTIPVTRRHDLTDTQWAILEQQAVEHRRRTPMVVATVGALCYFATAVAVHLRANDARNLPTPLAMAMIAAAVLVLGLATR